MFQSLNLEASGGALLIEPDPRGVPGVGWARCSLAPADSGPPRFLRADALDIIAGRVVASLDAGDEETASAPGGRAGHRNACSSGRVGAPHTSTLGVI